MFKRHQFFSSYTNDPNRYYAEWISKFTKNSVPKLCYEIQYVRSSGPGGQNVNKLNTKCSLKILNFSKAGFNIETPSAQDQHRWIPSFILDQLINGNKKTNFEKSDLMKLYYKPNQDSLVIQSDSHRSRHLNEADCFLKLKQLFEQGYYTEKEVSQDDKIKWEKIRAREKEKRLKEKKFKKLRKELKNS